MPQLLRHVQLAHLLSVRTSPGDGILPELSRTLRHLGHRRGHPRHRREQRHCHYHGEDTRARLICRRDGCEHGEHGLAASGAVIALASASRVVGDGPRDVQLGYEQRRQRPEGVHLLPGTREAVVGARVPAESARRPRGPPRAGLDGGGGRLAEHGNDGVAGEGRELRGAGHPAVQVALE